MTCHLTLPFVRDYDCCSVKCTEQLRLAWVWEHFLGCVRNLPLVHI